MELKDLVRQSVDATLTVLVDRPTRRFGRNAGNYHVSSEVRAEGIVLQQSGERRDAEARRYTASRKQIVSQVKELAARGIYGFYFHTDHLPLVIWWYQSASWRVTDLRRFMRSRAFRSNAAARGAVRFCWTGDVLGEAELALIEQTLGREFVNQCDVVITKDDFQSASGAKRAPVGTKEVLGRWSIKTSERWPKDDEMQE